MTPEELNRLAREAALEMVTACLAGLDGDPAPMAEVTDRLGASVPESDIVNFLGLMQRHYGEICGRALGVTAGALGMDRHVLWRAICLDMAASQPAGS